MTKSSVGIVVMLHVYGQFGRIPSLVLCCCGGGLNVISSVIHLAIATYPCPPFEEEE